MNLLENAIKTFDQGLKTIFAPAPLAQRQSPAADIEEAELSAAQRQQIAGLMRIDHAGEVCAQALYLGHALTAKTESIKVQMQQAADEENDHLAWCEMRLEELQSHRSHLNPLWYAGSFSLGVISGWLGEKWNLGFVAETERQVTHHLESHLERLPAEDEKSRAILLQMRDDELQHAHHAEEAGAAELPALIRFMMGKMSKVMTTIAEKI